MIDNALVRLRSEGLSVTATPPDDERVEITVLGTAEVVDAPPPAGALQVTAWEALRIDRAALQCLVWTEAGHLVYCEDTRVDLDYGAATPLPVSCRFDVPVAAAEAGHRVELRVQARAHDVYEPVPVDLAAIPMRWRVHPSLVPKGLPVPGGLAFSLFGERDPVDDRGQVRFDFSGVCPIRAGVRCERITVDMAALGGDGGWLWRDDSSSDVWGGASPAPFSVRFYPDWRPFELAERLSVTVRPRYESVDAPTSVPMPAFKRRER